MKYTLNERNIDAVCKEAYAFLVRRKTNPKDTNELRALVWNNPDEEDYTDEIVFEGD